MTDLSKTSGSSPPKNFRDPAPTICVTREKHLEYRDAVNAYCAAHKPEGSARTDSETYGISSEGLEAGLPKTLANASRRPNSDSRHDRSIVAARLARAIDRGSDVIYHGTRFPEKVFRSGKLIPHGGGVSFSRSPEVAAYFVYLDGSKGDGYLPALLVLNRSSLRQVYRFEPTRYAEDWNRDEEEEIVLGRAINFRRHLLGVVRDSDVSKVLGPPINKFVPSDWSCPQWMAYQNEAMRAGRRLFHEGRERVRDFIVRERKRTSIENAPSRVPPAVKSATTVDPERNEITKPLSAMKPTTQAKANTGAPAAADRESARSRDAKIGVPCDRK